MSAPPQAIAPNPHTNLLNVYIYIYIYIQIANKMGFKQKKSQVQVTLLLTVIQSVYLAIEHPCGTWDQILLPVGVLLSEICGLISVRPL
jgi:hypothetical protein